MTIESYKTKEKYKNIIGINQKINIKIEIRCKYKNYTLKSEF